MAVNESNTIQYTVTTSRVPDGTTLYWKTTGNTTNSDIVGGNTGSITITNNQAVFNVTIASDSNTDGTKTLGIAIATGSQNGPTVVSTANSIIVEDTSVSPAPQRLYAWGYSSDGQLGLNTRDSQSSPTQVGTDTNWSQISTHYNTSLGIKTDGTLWAWGDNDGGILGVGDQVNRSSPTQVGTATNWSSVNTTRFATAAIKTDGTLWLWGKNNYGNLATNDRVSRSSPTQVGTGWSQVKNSDQFGGLALKTNGTLWTWGSGYGGATGLNEPFVYRSSPVQIGSNTNWSKIDTSGRVSNAAAIKTDGTLWLWGRNNYGQLGLGDRVYRSSPVQIGSGTDWNLVSFGYKNCAAIKTNGTLWVWGENYLGSLGLNDVSHRSSPVQLGSGSTWNQVDLNATSGAAIKSNGTLWTWGQNNTGQLGHLPLYTYRSSPIQVGSGTTWTQITIGSLHMLAITTD